MFTVDLPLLEESEQEEACTKDVTSNSELVGVGIVTIIVLRVKVLMIFGLLHDVFLCEVISGIDLSTVVDEIIVLIFLGH